MSEGVIRCVGRDAIWFSAHRFQRDEKLNLCIAILRHSHFLPEKSRGFMPRHHGVAAGRNGGQRKMSFSIPVCRPTRGTDDDGCSHIRMEMTVHHDDARLLKRHLAGLVQRIVAEIEVLWRGQRKDVVKNWIQIGEGHSGPGRNHKQVRREAADMPKPKPAQPSRVVSIKRDVPTSHNKPKVVAHDPKGHRVIIAIGSQKIAFDFNTQITQLDPATGDRPAPVVPLRKGTEK
jgi:hypothetical protein